MGFDPRAALAGERPDLRKGLGSSYGLSPRHRVSDFRDFFALMPKEACVRDILPLKGTGEMANSSRSLKSEVFSLSA